MSHGDTVSLGIANRHLRRLLARQPRVEPSDLSLLAALDSISDFSAMILRNQPFSRDLHEERIANEEAARQKLITEKKQRAESLIFSGQFTQALEAIAEAEERLRHLEKSAQVDRRNGSETDQEAPRRSTEMRSSG